MAEHRHDNHHPLDLPVDTLAILAMALLPHRTMPQRPLGGVAARRHTIRRNEGPRTRLAR